jgi:hypothetical protein
MIEGYHHAEVDAVIFLPNPCLATTGYTHIDMQSNGRDL